MPGFFDVTPPRLGTWVVLVAGTVAPGLLAASLWGDGDIEMDGAQALSDEEIEKKDGRLTCVGRPASDYTVRQRL